MSYTYIVPPNWKPTIRGIPIKARAGDTCACGGTFYDRLSIEVAETKKVSASIFPTCDRCGKSAKSRHGKDIDAMARKELYGI